MMFDVHVVSQTDFASLASDTVKSDRVLNADSYKAELLKQSVPKDKPGYRLDDPELFEAIAMQKNSAGAGPGGSCEYRGRQCSVS